MYPLYQHLLHRCGDCENFLRQYGATSDCDIFKDLKQIRDVCNKIDAVQTQAEGGRQQQSAVSNFISKANSNVTLKELLVTAVLFSFVAIFWTRQAFITATTLSVSIIGRWAYCLSIRRREGPPESKLDPLAPNRINRRQLMLDLNALHSEAELYLSKLCSDLVTLKKSCFQRQNSYNMMMQQLVALYIVFCSLHAGLITVVQIFELQLQQESSSSSLENYQEQSIEKLSTTDTVEDFEFNEEVGNANMRKFKENPSDY